jgi:CheY-like chemotaxis protein
MVKAPQTKVLVVDRDLSVLSDYKLTLGGTPSEGKDDLLAEALRGDDSPPVTLISLQDPQEAPAVLREQIAGGSPIDIVFLEIGAPPAYEGLRAAERIRQLDPKVFLVIVSAYPDLHPTDLCKRVPPAERLFYLQKPLYPQEVLQLVYALGASRAAAGVGEERHGIDHGDRVAGTGDRPTSGRRRRL